ncbi:RNA polymerase sigma factor [Xinfangfangia sp. D13-10-4-6]|uniref:RNA polymerase sigma factor n=1 Tax=Pseudogemmobacter hezensis TaxID=2737662 RepID=UPI001553799B|nr:RNA polymerase sigma factor [Pseudogemmobacter hezensis]
MSATLISIFNRHRRRLMGQISRLTGDPHIAEDLLQETYLRAHRQMDQAAVHSVEGLLYRTSQNLALDHLRRSRHRARFEDTAEAFPDTAPSGEAAVEEQLIEAERQQVLQAELAAMPLRARHIWALHFVEGKTYTEIALALGISRNTVYNDMKLVTGRCRDALARMERT